MDMKKLDFVQKRCETSRVQAILDKTRSFFKVTTNAALVAGLALMPMAMPKALGAQDTIKEQKQATIRQVPINEIKKYVAEAEKCKTDKVLNINTTVYTTNFSDSTNISLSFFVDYETNKRAASDEAGNLVGLLIIPKGILSTKDPPRGYSIPLSELKTAYKEFSGQELKYVRVGFEIGKAAADEYVQFYIIPVASKGGEIASGTPIGVISYASSWTNPGAGGCDNKERFVISMK
jgi:hypothetical protein